MGQKLITLDMKGRLQLSIDGSPTTRPLDVTISGVELDLDELMREGHLVIDERDPSKVLIDLPSSIPFRLALEADEVLSRGSEAIVRGLEESL